MVLESKIEPECRVERTDSSSLSEIKLDGIQADVLSSYSHVEVEQVHSNEDYSSPYGTGVHVLISKGIDRIMEYLILLKTAKFSSAGGCVATLKESLFQE
ncbi:hypothetical protein ACH5RR_005167 [Cinchona calisaya]|uniref:Uncharacterized protein n=1 Tax=Cinchona calisaya TaxID=153742 RepID=A0ABD3AKE1_9GENT